MIFPIYLRSDKQFLTVFDHSCGIFKFWLPPIPPITHTQTPIHTKASHCLTWSWSLNVELTLYFFTDLDERILKQQQEEEERKRLRREKKKEKVRIVDSCSRLFLSPSSHFCLIFVLSYCH